MPRSKRGSKPVPPHAQEPPPAVEIQISATREERRALSDAVAEAVMGEPGGPWRVRVSSTLVYLTPDCGAWWLKVTLTSASGRTFAALLDPNEQTPAAIGQAVAGIVRGEVFTTVLLQPRPARPDVAAPRGRQGSRALDSRHLPGVRGEALPGHPAPQSRTAEEVGVTDRIRAGRRPVQG